MAEGLELFNDRTNSAENNMTWANVANQVLDSFRHSATPQDRKQVMEQSSLEVPPIFAQQPENTPPPGASPYDVGQAANSLKYILDMANGNKTDQRVVPVDGKMTLVGFQHGYVDTEGHPVEYATNICYRQTAVTDQNGNTHIVMQPFEQQTKMNVVYTLNNGDKAIVSYKSDQTVNRTLGQTAPNDDYLIIVVSADGKHSYRYPSGATLHVQGDGTQLKKDLEYLNQNSQKPSTQA